MNITLSILKSFVNVHTSDTPTSMSNKKKGTIPTAMNGDDCVILTAFNCKDATVRMKLLSDNQLTEQNAQHIPLLDERVIVIPSV